MNHSRTNFFNCLRFYLSYLDSSILEIRVITSQTGFYLELFQSYLREVSLIERMLEASPFLSDILI